MVSSQTVLVLTIACAFMFGLYVALLGSMRSQLAAHLGLGERSVGSLWAAMNFVLVPLTLVAGIVIDVGDVRWVIAAGSLFTATALLLLQGEGGFRRGMVAALLASAGFASLACAAMVLMPRAFFGSNEASASLNMGNVFFAFGALLAPSLAEVLLRGLGLKRSLFLLTLCALGPGILVLFVKPQDIPPAQDADFFALLLDPTVWLAGAVFFLYAPLEGCLHSWAEGYLRGLGKAERDIPKLIAGFWSCFMLGRLLTAFLQHRRWLPEDAERWMVFVMALGAFACLGNLVGAGSLRSATSGFLLLGLFLGPIFPTLLGFLFTHYENGLGTVFGVVFAIGSAGSLFFAPLITARVNRSTAQAAIRIPLMLSILMLVLSLVFALWHGESPR